jgi:hypothetical protein
MPAATRPCRQNPRLWPAAALESGEKANFSIDDCLRGHHAEFGSIATIMLQPYMLISNITKKWRGTNHAQVLALLPTFIVVAVDAIGMRIILPLLPFYSLRWARALAAADGFEVHIRLSFTEVSPNIAAKRSSARHVSLPGGV